MTNGGIVLVFSIEQPYGVSMELELDRQRQYTEKLKKKHLVTRSKKPTVASASLHALYKHGSDALPVKPEPDQY